MERTLSLPVQEFVRVSERVMASNHKSLPDGDCEAVLLYAYGLIRLCPNGIEGLL
jgi:hypothetical protein